MPKTSPEVIGTMRLHRHAWVPDDMILNAVVATVGSAHYGDETDEAADYVLAVGATAEVAKQVFPDAAIHIDSATLPSLKGEDLCLLAFSDANGAVVAFHGLGMTRAASHGSLWRVRYEHVSAREMTAA